LKNRPGDPYLPIENRRENILKPIRPIPDSSQTVGVGTPNKIFPIREKWHRGEKDWLKVL